MGRQYTKAQQKAYKKYVQNTDELRVRIPKGEKARYQQHASQCGETLNQFIIRAIETAMHHDTQTPEN